MARNVQTVNYRVMQPTPICVLDNKAPGSKDEIPRVMKKHPTIGEFYSQRARKKKLCQRRLPSTPILSKIYFVLMGKAWSYSINICVEHKLQRIVKSLTKLLASNHEIIEIIKQNCFASMSRKSSVCANPDAFVYDSIVQNPIFIYREEMYDGCQTLEDIGFDPRECANEYIVVLSCAMYESQISEATTFSEFV